MKRLILLLWLSLTLYPMTLNARESSSERQHIILAFDGATSLSLNNPSIRDTVTKTLFGDIVGLEDDDLLSVVCAAGNAENYDDPLVKVRFGWAKVECNNVKQKLANEWNDYAKRDWFSTPSEPYSLLSISKPYILKALSCDNTTNYVDRTIIIYITDNIYNGNDYYLEARYFLNNKIYSNDFYKSLNKLMTPCADVAEEYSIKFLGGRIVDVNHHRAYVDIFELVHNHQSINLSTVLSHRPIIEAKRQFGGNYTFDFDIKAYNNHFDVLSIEAYGYSGKSDDDVEGVHQQIYKHNEELTFGQSDVISGEFHRSAPFKFLHVKSLIHINENAYGATRFNLEHDVEIVLEPDATIVFGKIRLPDYIWLPWCDSQYEVAMGINIILVILAIIAFVIYILCRRSYTPTNDDITMGFYDVTNK